jgi:hypothetical protein
VLSCGLCYRFCVQPLVCFNFGVASSSRSCGTCQPLFFSASSSRPASALCAFASVRFVSGGARLLLRFRFPCQPALSFSSSVRRPLRILLLRFFRPAGRAFYFVLRCPVNFAGDYSFCQSPARFRPALLPSDRFVPGGAASTSSPPLVSTTCESPSFLLPPLALLPLKTGSPFQPTTARRAPHPSTADDAPSRGQPGACQPPNIPAGRDVGRLIYQLPGRRKNSSVPCRPASQSLGETPGHPRLISFVSARCPPQVLFPASTSRDPPGPACSAPRPPPSAAPGRPARSHR